MRQNDMPPPLPSGLSSSKIVSTNFRDAEIRRKNFRTFNDFTFLLNVTYKRQSMSQLSSIHITHLTLSHCRDLRLYCVGLEVALLLLTRGDR